jgi:hypothetical protein
MMVVSHGIAILSTYVDDDIHDNLTVYIPITHESMQIAVYTLPKI